MSAREWNHQLSNHHHNHCTALFRDQRVSQCQKRTSGLYGARGINRGRHTDWLGTTPSGLTHAHLHHHLPPIFFIWCPSCRSTNSVKALKATSAANAWITDCGWNTDLNLKLSKCESAWNFLRPREVSLSMGGCRPHKVCALCGNRVTKNQLNLFRRLATMHRSLLSVRLALALESTS